MFNYGRGKLPSLAKEGSFLKGLVQDSSNDPTLSHQMRNEMRSHFKNGPEDIIFWASALAAWRQYQDNFHSVSDMARQRIQFEQSHRSEFGFHLDRARKTDRVP